MHIYTSNPYNVLGRKALIKRTVSLNHNARLHAERITQKKSNSFGLFYISQYIYLTWQQLIIIFFDFRKTFWWGNLSLMKTSLSKASSYKTQRNSSQMVSNICLIYGNKWMQIMVHIQCAAELPSTYKSQKYLPT